MAKKAWPKRVALVTGYYRPGTGIEDPVRYSVVVTDMSAKQDLKVLTDRSFTEENTIDLESEVDDYIGAITHNDLMVIHTHKALPLIPDGKGGWRSLSMSRSEYLTYLRERPEANDLV